MRNTLIFLFGFSQLVNRSKYLRWGIGLMLLKFVSEVLLIYYFQNRLLSPFEFLNPTLSGKQAAYAPAGFSQIPLFVSFFSSLLFLWIGLSMTARRAFDAGKSPWLLLFFFLPYLNLVLMLWLCVLPSATAQISASHREQVSEPFRATFAALLGFALIGTLVIATLTFVARAYGSILFAATPCAMGASIGYFLNRNRLISIRKTISLVLGTMAIWSGFVFLFALEGAVCIAMAMPIAATMGIFGALLGRKCAEIGRLQPTRLSAVFFIPALVGASWVEEQISPKLYGEVISEVIIDAPAQVVWKNVVTFPQLEPPEEIIFKAGVSYPIQARIEGHGVGATRYCEFNSGSFVEPITAWDEPTRLAFDVKFQPKPMNELSIWQNIEAPHLDGFFVSKRGEFRLKELSGQRTQLAGSTWYELQIFPSQYWQLYSEWIVHKIHMRVLEHIKKNSEN